jgi:hypothetical protein
MTTKAEIIATIQAAADACGDNQMRIGLGAPGSVVENAIGEQKSTGSAWAPEPKSQALIIEGIAAWLDDAGVGSALKLKLNELIGAYNQLREDYNAGTVPTTAPEVDPLP